MSHEDDAQQPGPHLQAHTAQHQQSLQQTTMRNVQGVSTGPLYDHLAGGIDTDAQATADSQLIHELTGALDRLCIHGPAPPEASQQVAAIADGAYRAGVRCLEREAFADAIGLLTVALRACPPSKTRAVTKVETLLKYAQSQLSVTTL